MEDKIIINVVNPETFELQDYSVSDTELLAVNELDTAFTSSTDFIETFIYDENQNRISSVIPFTGYTVTEGNVVLTPSNDLERLGFFNGAYYISYNFYRPQLGSSLNNTLYISEISSDATEIRLDSTQISNELLISSSLEFIAYREEADYFVDFYLNFGENETVIANNIELDLEDEDNPTVLIKLYDPLPSNIGIKSVCYVVEEISTPQSYNVTFPPPQFTPDDFEYLSGPNFNLNIKGQSGSPGIDHSYSTLVASNLTSSFNQIDSLLNRKEIEISVNYENYNNFVYFSSAYTRLQNFAYKAGLIESASLQLGTLTSETTGSAAYSASEASLTSLIDTTIKNFDGYEYFLYYNSGSAYSWPKTTTEPPYALASTSSALAVSWLGNTDENDADYGGQALSASNYDLNNQDSLYYSIPEYLRSDPQNARYELFVDMVGQHYDNIWQYTKNITSKFDADNRLDFGISKDMVADAVRDFGIKLYSNNFNTDDLYLAFLGLTPSGSTFPVTNITDSTPVLVTGSEFIDTKISSSNDIIPLDDANKRLYKRIYHNIPYLLKTKGTIAGLRALITSYGIPDTILRISEFGGKDRNNNQDWDLKQDVYNRAAKTETSQFNTSFELNSNWNSINDRPAALQFRFKTNGIPSGSSTPTTQSIFYSISPSSKIAMALDYDMSLLASGSYSGSVDSSYRNYGTLTFWPNADISANNTASLYLPFWDGNWWSIQVNKQSEAGNVNTGTVTLSAANKIGENLGFTGSDTITADLTKWNDTTQIVWFTGSVLELATKDYFPFTGSVQEVRYYTEPISESVFYDFTLNPYSFEGNGVNSAPDQLAFRLPLGTMLNTSSAAVSESIHPKVTGSFVTTSSFPSNVNTASFINTFEFENNVEDIYLDQTPSGMRNRVTDKVQTEALILPSGDTLSSVRSIQQESFVSESFTPSVNYLEVAFSPQNQINDDIIGQLGYFNIGEYIGDPRFISSSDTSYPSLDLLRDAYFEKYITNYDVTDFIRLIKFFDNSLFKMIEDFTPSRTSLTSGVVIKQHLLERNRQRPAIVSSSFEQYSGSVTNLPKDYSTGSSDFPQYSDSGSAIYKFGGGTGGSFETFNNLATYPSGTLGDGPDNRYFLTQSWSESISTLSGSAPLARVDQREFYNGEFSGSLITASMKDICSAYFKVGLNNYTYVPAFWSADGNNGTGTISESDFLSPTNQPPAGYVWFWNNGQQGSPPNASGNVSYIKLSLETYNGLSILNFIQGVDFITFNLNSPLDINGEILQGPQTYIIESIAIQPETLSNSAGSVGSALCFTVPELSSTAIVSADAAFYDFTLDATGDFQWHATEDTSADPNPVLNTGISASVPQSYFPLTSTYPTESFFRGWASSNFYTNGTFNSYNGILNDPLDNFNTGSKELDNTDNPTQLDPTPNGYPWFMNAYLDAQNQNWIYIPSESFLDYANIPDSSAGPVATNNYFNIAWTSQSSAETPAIQGVNYYYNASNNAIYISGSEFQDDIKQPNPKFSSSLTTQLIDYNSGTTTYTPPGQTSLDIPIGNHNQLWVYRGQTNAAPGFDSDQLWRYNRYKHRSFKIYYLTNSGSGVPAIPYDLYDPMVHSVNTTVPLYYDVTIGAQPRTFATMLGTSGDTTYNPPQYQANLPSYWRPLNSTETMPSTTATSGSFSVYNEARQVRPFIFTTYRNVVQGSFINQAEGSGSAVAISKSDGTPFACLRMYQIQTIAPTVNNGQNFIYECIFNGGLPFCEIRYYREDGSVSTTVNVSVGDTYEFCGDSTKTTGTILAFNFAQNSSINTNPNGTACLNSGPGVVDDPEGLSSNNFVNEFPYFYDSISQKVSVSDNLGTLAKIRFGQNFEGENTSSFSLETGTQPGGDSQTTDLVFPAGNYIFTMSDFDTGRFTGGRTEFGLWTSYGDYVTYDFENQNGSGANPVTIDYVNALHLSDSINVYEYAVQSSDGNGGQDPARQNGNGTYVDDTFNYRVQKLSQSTVYQRINVEVDGTYQFRLSRETQYGVNIKVFVEPNQSTTGATPSANASEVFELINGATIGLTPNQALVPLPGLTAGQQILVQISGTYSNFYTYISELYNTSIENPSQIAKMGSPEAQGSFNDPYVVTGSISNKYSSGVTVPPDFATKVEGAYLVYSQSASSSLAGSYIFDVTPTFGQIFITASVVVSSFTDEQSALYGNAIYGTSEYGGGNAGGGTTWTTASLIIYSGSANNFPNEMPQLGGDIFAITSSNSLTHHTGERITLMTSITPSEIEYNKALKLALLVGSGSNASSVVQNSLIVTEYSMSFSSSVEIPEDPSIPVVFSDDLNFDKAFDCQPLLNNYSDSRINNRLQDVDYGQYNSGSLFVPSNWGQIIINSASRASVPESNYTTLSSTSARYLGKTTNAETINAWSPGDSGTYGKLPTIEIARGFLGYFNKSSDLYPILNQHTLYSLQYLIGENGDANQPKLSDISLYNVQGTFNSYPYNDRARVSINKPEVEILNELSGLKEIKKVTQRPVPIIYTQQSGLFPITGSIGLELIGSEPVDPNIAPNFANYSVDASSRETGTAASTISSQTLFATQKTPVATAAPNITASFGSGPTKVYEEDSNSGNVGILSIPNTDGYPAAQDGGDGKSTSQPYTLRMSIGIDTSPLTYPVQTSNPNKHGNFNENNIVGDLVVKPQRSNSLTGGFGGIYLQNVTVTLTNYFQPAAGTGAITTTLNYQSFASSDVNISSAGVQIIFNTNRIRAAVQATGQNPDAQVDGGTLLKQTWTISGDVPAYTIKQGRRFRINALGDFIVGSSAADPARNPKFFPNVNVNNASGGYEYQMILEGANSNPTTNATGSFWQPDGLGQSVVDYSTIVCTSVQLNKAYGRGFIQKDLVYTSSLNKDYPEGIEPAYAAFPKIVTPWSVQPYDEIRFNNSEDNSFLIEEIIEPASSPSSSDNTGQLILKLDREVPPSFFNPITGSLAGKGIALDPLATSSQAVVTSGTDISVVGNEAIPQFKEVEFGEQIFKPIDNFLIRRYIDDASAMVISQQYPQTNPPNTSSATGFLVPEYPVATLKTNPDEVLSDLVDKRLIE